MYLYRQFVLKHAIRFSAQLVNPPVSSDSDLALPVGSIYHYQDFDAETFGEDDRLLQNMSSRYVVANVEHIDVDQYTGFDHFRIKKHPLNFRSKDIEFYQNHPDVFRYAQYRDRLPREARTLLVVNYGLSEQHFEHLPTPYTGYWVNYVRARTLMLNIQTFDVPGRQHYINVHVPSVVPSRQTLTRWTATQELNSKIAQELADPNAYMLYQLWLMVGRDVQGCFNMLSDKNILDRVHLIIHTSTRWTALNLGSLLGWLKDESGRGSGWDVEEARRKLLVMFLRLSEVVDIVSDDSASEDVAEDDLPTSETMPDEVSGAVGNKTPLIAEKAMKVRNAVVAAPVEKAVDDDDDELIDADSQDESVIAAQEEAMLAALEIREKEASEQKTSELYEAYEPDQNKTSADEVDRIAKDLFKKGVLTDREVKRHQTLARKHLTIKSPYTSQTMDQYLKIDPEELKIENNNPLCEVKTELLIDKSMASSSMQKFDQKYIRNTMKKELVACALGIQNAGVSVTDYKVNRYTTLHDDYEVHSMKIIPVVGAESTISFKVPVVREDGTFISAGTTYRMRKQWGDVPIRKIDKHQVALTSYYSKLFIERSARMTNNYDVWLSRAVNVGINIDRTITAVRYRKCFVQTESLPRDYGILSSEYASFMHNGFMYNFDITRLEKVFPKAPKVKKGEIVIAVNAKFDHLVLTTDNTVHKVSASGDKEELGRLAKIFDPSASEPPLEMVEMSLFGKAMPIGLVLGRYLGLGNLLATLKVKHRRTPRHGRADAPEAGEAKIVFLDENLIYDTTDRVASMILSGFIRAHATIKHHSIYQFDKPDVYGVVMDSLDITSRHTRELDLARKMWVDPITKNLLEEMKEPTDFIQLLFRAVELLKDDQFMDEFDTRGMRIKGYERIAGIAYTHLVASARGFHIRPNNPKVSMSLNPEEIWYAVVQDQTTAPVDESNPIQALKDQDVVVYSGAGGRSSDTMSAKTRVYHKSAVGIISEGTVDSGDAATIVYLTADPALTSVHGQMKTSDVETMKPTKGISPSFLMAPGLEFDDGKRLNFCGVQNSQTTHILGAVFPPCRTGYESVVGFRAGALYANYADENGEVVAVNKHAVHVKYGQTVKAYPVGVVFGKWSGKIIPHRLVPAVKVGDRVKTEDVITYNSHFFSFDPIAPDHLAMHFGQVARVAFLDYRDTHEDGTAFSRKFADKLVTTVTHVRDILVDSHVGVTGLLSVGDHVEPDTVLCQLSPAMDTGLAISSGALDTLKRVSSLSPKAKSVGVIEKIEMLYTCEPEQMSSSLRELVEESDSRLIARKRQLKENLADGRVSVGFRSGGKVLGDNQVLIQVYITEEIGYRDGDKAVVAHQLKTVTGHVVEEGFHDEDNKPIDIMFGAKAVAARIVGSVQIMGGVGTIMAEIGKRMAEAYRGRG